MKSCAMLRNYHSPGQGPVLGLLRASQHSKPLLPCFSAGQRATKSRGRRILPSRAGAASTRQVIRRAGTDLRSGIAVVLLVALSGCAVGPDFVPPPAPVASSWLEWRNKSLKTGEYEYRDWWRLFRDPVLDRLIALAYEQNLTLLSAGTKVLQARAARRHSKALAP
jgi:hypothetical protein